ncbi:recombinase family protein [Cognatiluteimonas profundi]|uniref:recombinase family protein n=1 Tax=Cognatiluteimonas profundi TaxID=2594501 RepID=UPI00131DED66|nr:recombinase family protein [Lysobacter profundi]
MTTQAKAKRVAIYVRVSTGEQTTENQRRELLEVAESAGWDVVGVFADEGISGAKGRDRRPQFDAVLKLVTQRKVDLVAAWSVDRLGRSLQHLVETLSELQAAGADLYLHKQALDTTTPAGRAMFGMLGVFAEFEREIIRERVVSGMQRAKAGGRTFGRPKLADGTGERVRALRAQGRSLRQIAQEVGCGLGSVQRALAEAA